MEANGGRKEEITEKGKRKREGKRNGRGKETGRKREIEITGKGKAEKK